jgi:hypothetical protein
MLAKGRWDLTHVSKVKHAQTVEIFMQFITYLQHDKDEF